MSTNDFKLWIRRLSLTGGVAIAAGGFGAAVAASASHAQCTATSQGCGHAQTGQTETGAHPQGGGTTNSHRQADPRDGILPLSAQAQPILNRRVTLDGASGIVLIKAPHGTFVPLGAGASVPVGSVVNATHGAVTLTSVKDAGGSVQSGRFWGATFSVTQTGGAHPTTLLTLVGSTGACPAAHSRIAVTAARSRSRLWGHDSHGRFSTRGHYGVASVRGTVWMTQDTCSATLFTVTRGAIVVHDLHRHRHVRVTAGHSYAAHK
jgi:hypothetical protein